VKLIAYSNELMKIKLFKLQRI